MNIYQRMNAVMKAVSYVQKEDKKVNNQYTFVSHDAVTKVVRPHLIDAGIMLTTSVDSFTQDGNRTEAVVTLEFVNIDKPEDRISVKSFGYGIDPQDKGPGKAVSYAVKYGILKTLCLETGDDPERASIDHEPAPKAKGTITPTTGAMDRMDSKRKVAVEKLAGHIEGKFSSGEEWAAFEAYSTSDEDPDFRVAVWSLLSSKCRSTLKAMKAESEKPVEKEAA